MVIFCKNDKYDTRLSEVGQGKYFILNGIPYIKTSMCFYDTCYNLYYKCMEIATIKQKCSNCSLLNIATDELVIPIEVSITEKETVELRGIRAQNLVSGDCFKDKNFNLIMKFYYNTYPYFLNLRTGEVFEVSPQYAVNNKVDINIERR